MYRWLLAIALGTLACGCEDYPVEPTGPGTTETTSTGSETTDTTTTTDTGTTTVQKGPCLPRPTDLPRPPTGQLPCELFPPTE